MIKKNKQNKNNHKLKPPKKTGMVSASLGEIKELIPVTFSQNRSRVLLKLSGCRQKANKETLKKLQTARREREAEEQMKMP